jgi:SAM-dependent methyltransferase
MYLDVVDLRAFYAERLGAIARRLIAEKLRRRWPSVAGERVLGIGYATPYLGDFEGAERLLAFMPAVQGVVNWPSDGPNAAALVADDSLPLSDASIDRVLVIHSLEVSESARDQLREIRRVLAPGGRVILVVPNRRGIWARVERTPFGFGRPFTRGQLTALLREAMFSPLDWSEALALPPFGRRLWLRTGATWEKLGVTLWPAFAGVIIVEATKQHYQGVPARARARLKPAFSPALAQPGAGALGRVPISRPRFQTAFAGETPVTKL